MPLYEYQCKSCGVTQEVMQKVSDPAPGECSACHGGPLVKLLSRTAFILKGNGWYVTDFRDNGKKAATSVDGKDSAKESSKDEKPAAASAGKDTSSAPVPETKAADSSAKDGGSAAPTSSASGS